MNPLISVVLPVYNCQDYVLAAINSILEQTFSDFELLVIDDASTDQTPHLIRTLRDPRLQLIEKPQNSGYTDSLNYGISIAKGAYIARMDADDISLSNRFAKQIEFLETHPKAILCGSAYRILGTQQQIFVPEEHQDIKSALLRASCFAHPSVMMRKSALGPFPVYNKAFEPAEDYDLWTRLVVAGELHNLPEVLLEYRVHEQQVSQTRAKKQQAGSVHARLQMLDYLSHNLSPDERAGLEKVLSRSALELTDIEAFLQAKAKLLAANENGFFEKVDFGRYFEQMERRFVREFFLFRTQYRPYIYIGYQRLKDRLSYRLSTAETLRLLVKSVLFYHVSKS